MRKISNRKDTKNTIIITFSKRTKKIVKLKPNNKNAKLRHQTIIIETKNIIVYSHVAKKIITQWLKRQRMPDMQFGLHSSQQANDDLHAATPNL